MMTRFEILRAICLGSICLSLMMVGGMTVPRAVPAVLGWGQSVGPLAAVLAVLGLVVAIFVIGLCYLFVACVVAAAVARVFVAPETVSRLVVDGAWSGFDRALLSTLRRLRIAR